MTTRCGECGKRFNPTNEDEVDEWQWHCKQELDQEERRELKRLRERVREYEQRDADYVAWSLGGGMVKAILAGVEIANKAQRETT